jgi:hypothetical protein
LTLVAAARGRFGDTKDLAFATARLFVRQVRAAWKDAASPELRARALINLFASTDMQDVFDALDVLAFEVGAPYPHVTIVAAACLRRTTGGERRDVGQLAQHGGRISAFRARTSAHNSIAARFTTDRQTFWAR